MTNATISYTDDLLTTPAGDERRRILRQRGKATGRSRPPSPQDRGRTGYAGR